MVSVVVADEVDRVDVRVVGVRRGVAQDGAVVVGRVGTVVHAHPPVPRKFGCLSGMAILHAVEE